MVLVADDEPTMLELVTRHLRSIEPKLEVIEASDGDEAWRLARERLPDLVVLDVMMPGMSGWEVCRKIRQDAALAHTGVLMLTGIGESLNEATSPLFGADEYIDKPFDFEKLDEKIESVLAKTSRSTRSSPSSHGQNAVGFAAARQWGGRAGEGGVREASKAKRVRKGQAGESARNRSRSKKHPRKRRRERRPWLRRRRRRLRRRRRRPRRRRRRSSLRSLL